MDQDKKNSMESPYSHGTARARVDVRVDMQRHRRRGLGVGRTAAGGRK